MKIRKIMIIITIFFVSICMNFILSPKIDAYTFEGYDATGAKSMEDKIYKSDYNNVELVNSTQKVVGTIIQAFRVVGMGIAIIMLTYVAIKYMSAAPSEKADFKKSAVAYIVGAVVLFGASNLLAIIANFATQNIK